MKFVQLSQQLKEGLSPVYLVDGEEAFFRDHAVDAIRKACGITQPLLNDVRFEGDSVKGDKLQSFRDNLYALPFFDGKRLVRLTDFYPTEREWAILQPYIENPSPSTVLVIVNADKKGNSVDIKKKKGIVHVDCSKESEEMLTRWLFALARREGLVMSADVASLMIRYCNMNAARSKIEIAKLKMLLGEGGKVTREVVEENVSKDVEYKIYELTQAASARNFTAFSQILADLLNKGFDENSVLASLTSHYKTLTEISSMRGSDADIAKQLSLHPYVVKKNREVLSRIGKERAEELYLALYALSSGVKSGLYSKTGALSAAEAKIFFR